MALLVHTLTVRAYLLVCNVNSRILPTELGLTEFPTVQTQALNYTSLHTFNDSKPFLFTPTDALPTTKGETVPIYIQSSDLRWFLYFARERFMEVEKLYSTTFLSASCS